MMKPTLLVCLLVANLTCTGNALSQSMLDDDSLLARGITFEYGIGDFAITDENISKEMYSGSLPWLSVQWARDHTRNHFRLGFEVRSSGEIRNNNVATDITQFSLYQAFLYPLSNVSIFGRDVIALVGPSTEMYFFLNSQDIAVTALGFAQSVAALISVGTRIEMVMPLSPRLKAEGSLRAGILSLGFRAVDDERMDEPPARLLTALSGTHVVLRLGARYTLSGKWSCRLSYILDVTRIKPWQPLLSASDSLIFGLTWGL